MKSNKNAKKTTPKKVVQKATAPKEKTLIAVPEPEKKSRGGLRDYSEAKAKTVQRVRGEFLSDTFKPKITIAYTNITFNMACVNLFPNNQYVSISIDEENQRIIVEPEEKNYDRDGLKFANVKLGRNVPRTCTTKNFCGMLFDIMGKMKDENKKWNNHSKYRILAIYQEFGEKKIIVFNLDEAQEVITETIELADGKKKRNTKVNMPPEWKGRFGYSMDELEDKKRVKFSSTLRTYDPKTGEMRDGSIEPKRPTNEEIMREPYGDKRSRKKEENEDE